MTALHTLSALPALHTLRALHTLHALRSMEMKLNILPELVLPGE